MRATIELSLEELDSALVARLRSLFGHQNVRLTLTATEADDNAHLLSTGANRAHLQRSLGEVAQGKVVAFEASEFFRAYQAKLANADDPV
jgi:hypothetical protein